MLGILFWILVGVFIGWNFPQPAYAKALQDRVVAWWKDLTGQGDSSGKN